MRLNTSIALFVLLVVSPISQAWWNEDWESRKQIGVDTSITGADLKENLVNFPILVRLHAGNFSYFSEMDKEGKDIRIMADDKTPLKYQIERFDPVGEMALVWVRMPTLQGAATSDTFWMYYGNEGAPAADSAAGVYDDSFGLVYHFNEDNGPPQDSTAFGNHGSNAPYQVESAGWIGKSANFEGKGSVNIKPSPSLLVDAAKGWSFSAWIKPAQQTGDAYIIRASEANNAVAIILRQRGLLGRFESNGKSVETPVAGIPQDDQWHHVGLIVRGNKLELFLDGINTSSVPITLVTMNPMVSLGGAVASGFYNGLMDEVQISNVARPVDWMKLSHRSQSPEFTILSLGQDEGKDSGGNGSSFIVIIQNVTIDGWIVIGLTGIMFVIAIMVIIIKTIVIRRVRKDNKAFMVDYQKIVDSEDISALDREETEEEKELENDDFLSAVVGKHDHYQSSPLYHIYHTGINEMNKRVKGKNARPLSPEAWNVIRVMVDSIIVREGQRLNSKMVLLTIAIAGGPFLGLLGTVVGVMITFAVIAATGDVNINSIAPGIAAALLATVAGLAVAIPALFAYNYLLVQIKDITADMRVFSDEFLAALTEKVADRFR